MTDGILLSIFGIFGVTFVSIAGVVVYRHPPAFFIIVIGIALVAWVVKAALGGPAKSVTETPQTPGTGEQS